VKKEIWRDIKNFTGYYQVSDIGKVRSLDRIVKNRKYGLMKVKSQIIKQSIDSGGYLMVSLCKNGTHYTRKIHILVWDAFGDKPRNGRKLQIDHVNGIKTDNHISNLQLLTPRQNTTKSKKSKTGLTGAYQDRNGFISLIQINGKQNYLGRFATKQEAHQAYQNKLEELKT